MALMVQNWVSNLDCVKDEDLFESESVKSESTDMEVEVVYKDFFNNFKKEEDNKIFNKQNHDNRDVINLIGGNESQEECQEEYLIEYQEEYPIECQEEKQENCKDEFFEKEEVNMNTNTNMNMNTNTNMNKNNFKEIFRSENPMDEIICNMEIGENIIYKMRKIWSTMTRNRISKLDKIIIRNICLELMKECDKPF